MKRFYRIGARTGLTVREINKVAVFGLIAALFASLAGCFKNIKPSGPDVPAPKADERAKPASLQDLVDSIKKSESNKSAADDNCGPYPGYPCGTRYYTVGVSDMLRKWRS